MRIFIIDNFELCFNVTFNKEDLSRMNYTNLLDMTFQTLHILLTCIIYGFKIEKNLLDVLKRNK